MVNLKAKIGLVLAAHGDRGGDRSNDWLSSNAAAIAGTAGIATCAAGVLKGEPTLEQALAGVAAAAPERILVYPFFMSSGYFVETVLPQRIRDTGLAIPTNVLPPLGLDPGLPALMLETGLRSAAEAGFDPGSSRMLVVGHGSAGSRASAIATELIALKLASTARFADVSAAFLEEPPFVRDALEGDKPPTVVAGFFSGDGLHAAQDVPAAIAWSGARAVYTGSIGSHPDVTRLVAAAVARAIEAAAA